MSFIKNKGDLTRVAAVKRFMEYTGFIPGFTNEYLSAPEKTLLKYNLHLTPDDLAAEEDKIGAKPKSPNGALARYIDFMTEKLRWREDMRTSFTPENAVYAKWRQRQIDRCIAAFPSQRSSALVHEAVSFELSSGCSIGCPFCGLSAGKLSDVFRYTPENAALWNGVLDVCRRVLGNIAGNSTCYYGTEPLDNPDYERFIDDFHAHFQRYPQLTTAASCRDLERTRRLVAAVSPESETIYRLSVRSREEFQKIIGTFSPEELVLVELLPQYASAPACSLIPVGRNATPETGYGDTIACVSGFLVNLCTKSIRLITPVKASARFPNGQVELLSETFFDAASFETALLGMIAQLKNILSPSEVLALYPYLHTESRGDAFSLVNESDFHIDADRDRSRPLFARIVTLLFEGAYTRRKVVALMKNEFPDMDAAALFCTINLLWNKGLIWDAQLFGAPGTAL